MARNTLTAEQIVRAAVGLLDEEGLDGLNMRSLGQRLDSAATAIYWHIRTKDELVRLAADAVWAEIPAPDLDAADADWRTAATELAGGLYGMLQRHPWLGQAFGGHFLYGPGKFAYDDRTLAVYEKAGFPPEDADRAAASVFVYVLGNALGSAAQVAMGRKVARGGEQAERRQAEAAARALAVASEFPLLRQRLGSPAADYAAAPDRSFDFGLQALLDGFEARLARR